MINALRETDEVTRFLGQSDFGAGKDTKFEITKYQGRDLITVAPSRLRTDIALIDTESYEGGYGWKATSRAINFLMVAKSAVMHVVKYNKVKVVSGEANLAARGFDGYTIFARIYHDVFVPDNKRVALYCSVEASATPAPAMKLDVQVKGGKVASITTLPGDKLAFVVTSSGTAELGGTLSEVSMVKVGDAVTGTTKFYAISSDKKVLAIHEYTAE